MIAPEDLECPICLQYFNEPLLLPCGHSYCKACLKQLKSLVCPCCQQDFPTVDSMSLNTKLLKELDQLHLKCHNCNTLPASWCCEKCPDGAYYCTDCDKAIHSLPAFQAHPRSETKEKRPPNIKCQAHLKDLQLYCTDCQHLLCLDCVEQHGQHTLQTLAKAAELKKAELRCFVKAFHDVEPLVKMEKDCVALKERYERRLRVLEVKVQEVKGEMLGCDERIGRIKEQKEKVEQSEKGFLENVQCMADVHLLDKRSVQKMKQRIRNEVHSISPESSPPLPKKQRVSFLKGIQALDARSPRVEKERVDNERVEGVEMDRERVLRERRTDKERVDKKRIVEKERGYKERPEKERLEKGRPDKERADKERTEKERIEERDVEVRKEGRKVKEAAPVGWNFLPPPSNEAYRPPYAPFLYPYQNQPPPPFQNSHMHIFSQPFQPFPTIPQPLQTNPQTLQTNPQPFPTNPSQNPLLFPHKH